MTDIQILTIVISIVFPVSAVIYSNSRINDAKETLSAKIDILRADMNLAFERLDHKLEKHELEHHR